MVPTHPRPIGVLRRTVVRATRPAVGAVRTVARVTRPADRVRLRSARDVRPRDVPSVDGTADGGASSGGLPRHGPAGGSRPEGPPLTGEPREPFEPHELRALRTVERAGDEAVTETARRAASAYLDARRHRLRRELDRQR